MTERDGIKVVIFEENELLRDSLSMLIEASDEFSLAGACFQYADLSQLIQYAEPDVVILDIDMPGVNGVDIIKHIRMDFPTVQVLVQTAFEDDEKVLASLKAGASGYILKIGSPKQLLQNLLEVFNGGAMVSPGIARKLLLHFQHQETLGEKKDCRLSSRETEVLDLLVGGLSLIVIAEKFSISYDAVRARMKKIYQKLHRPVMTEEVG